MNSMYFTEEHNLFRESIQDFLKKEVVPNIDKWEEAAYRPGVLTPPMTWEEAAKKFGENSISANS